MKANLRIFLEYSSDLGYRTPLVAENTNRISDIFTQIFGLEQKKKQIIIVVSSTN
jgi:hypothetical protein